MGEYAEYNGEMVKIGTCESMYYLRHEDREKVNPVEGSLDPRTCHNLFWRLPFPDEDNVTPGDYERFDRGVPLGVAFEGPAEPEGIIQLTHACGLMINYPCHHGHTQERPGGAGVGVFWNGRAQWFYELAHIKNMPDGTFRAVYRCRFCGKMWSIGPEDWPEFRQHIVDEELAKRLDKYFSCCSVCGKEIREGEMPLYDEFCECEK